MVFSNKNIIYSRGGCLFIEFLSALQRFLKKDMKISFVRWIMKTLTENKDTEHRCV